MTTTSMSQSIADSVLLPPADRARTSDERERRLADYVRAHTDADVTVTLTPHVSAACVIPTTEDALVDTENAEFSPEQACRLIAQVDTGYLVLISTRAATIERLPIDDQLTADRAQQFGFALHELGHIRYTAMAQVATLFDQAVDDAYQEFVAELWNTCEDAAIEHQLAVDQSQLAADRLTLTRQSLSPHAGELPANARQQRYTFADAITTTLYDYGIYDTGRCEVLCDPDDARIGFQAEADHQAYDHVADDIHQLLATVLSTPDSLERAEHVLKCWQTVLQPLIDPSHEAAAADESTAPSADAAGASDGTTTADAAERATTDLADISSDAASADAQPRPAPNEITIERTNDTPHSDALAYPSIGEAETAETLAPADQPATDITATAHSSQQSADEDTTTADGVTQNDSPAETPAELSTVDVSPQEIASADRSEPSDRRTAGDTAAPADDSSPDTSSQATAARSDHDNTPEPDETETGVAEDVSSASHYLWGPDQTTLDEFYDTTEPSDLPTEIDDGNDEESVPHLSSTTDSDEETPPSCDNQGGTDPQTEGEEDNETTTTTGTDITADNGNMGSTATDDIPGSKPSDTTGENDDPTDSSGGDGPRLDTADTTERTDGKVTSTSVHTAEQLERAEALTTDQQAAHKEADQATPDATALDQDLDDVAETLDQLVDRTGATPDSLDELTLMPACEDQAHPKRWQTATANAAFVGETLRSALRESRHAARRAGVTSGAFDRQRVGALARGEVNTFHVRQPGDEKAYDLVLILDRSGSMGNSVTTAEDGLVRFALACEAIGINVAVIDFTAGEARLIKPFSVECEYVQGSLMATETGGGTPLADALGLARELLDQRANHPLILIVSDGKPGDQEAYHDELSACYAPVCGLTLVLDSPTDHVPSRVADTEQFYDRHVYVHNSEQLDDRLDQFAVMFDGL